MQSFANKTEKSLSNLAQLIEIPIQHGWKKKIAEWLEIKLVLLSTWINRDSIPQKQLTRISAKGYPPEKWLTKEKPAPVARKKRRPRGADAPKTGRSDTARRPPVRLVAGDDEWYIEAVRQILASEEKSVAEALKANVRQFHDQVQDKARIREMEKEIWALKKALQKPNNPPKRGAGA